MVTIDLTTPPPPPASFLDAMARRVALTLPELRLVAELAGNAPLPFDLPATAPDRSADSTSGPETGSTSRNGGTSPPSASTSSARFSSSSMVSSGGGPSRTVTTQS